MISYEEELLHKILHADSTQAHKIDEHVDGGERGMVFQGEMFEKQIKSFMPDGQPAAIRLYPIQPPCTGDLPTFLNACTACGKCIKACPEKILHKADDEYGPDHKGWPTMSFEMGYCRPNCTHCVDVCKKGAISLLNIEANKDREPNQFVGKRYDKIGWAQYNSRTCLNHAEGIDCDACSRHCPQHAIVMREQNGHKVPAVIPSRCTGCGACEFYCPARPKAIYVEGM